MSGYLTERERAVLERRLEGIKDPYDEIPDQVRAALDALQHRGRHDGSQKTTRRAIDAPPEDLTRVEHGESFVEALRALPVHLSFQDFVPIRTWLTNLTNGLPSAVISAVCPDYATKVEPSTGRTVYTFDGLGEGVGLVASRAFEAQERLWHFFRERCPGVRFIIAIADQEADSEENCRRVGLSRDDFLERIRTSQRALEAMAPKEMSLETPFLTEINPRKWSEAKESARSLATNPAVAGKRDIRRVTSKRRRFYCRWAGKQLDREELQRMALSQVPEYAAIGIYLKSILSNPLILAADSPVMAPFVTLLTGPALPILYLDKPSYH